MATTLGVIGRSDLYQVDPRTIVVTAGWNRRKDFDDIPELAADISANGAITPVILQRQPDESLALIDGERRYRACMYAIDTLGAGIQSIPAIIRKKGFSQEEALIQATVANHGKPYHPWELAEIYRQFEAWGWAQAEIARRMGKSQSHVSRTLELVDTTPATIQALKDGDITQGEAQQVVRAATQAPALQPGKSTVVQPDVQPNGEHVKSIPLPATPAPDAPTLQADALKKLTDQGQTRPKRRTAAKHARFLKLLVQEVCENFGDYDTYKSKRGDAPYSGTEMTAFTSGRLSMLCELCGADKDLDDLEALLQQAKDMA